MAMHAPATLLIVGSLLMMSYCQTGPTDCSYDDGVYVCDYTAMTSAADRPIDFAQFSEEPQRIELIVNGFLPYFGDTSVFSSGFSGIDISAFDANHPASLNIRCDFGSSIYMQAATFTYMSHTQHLTIKDCESIYLEASVFQDLVSLDYLSFDRGILTDVETMAMFDMSLEKLTSSAHVIPRNLGHFEAKYAKFVDKIVPIGLLYNWKNLSSAALVGADIETITADTFTFNSKIKLIDISDNPFTEMPPGMFDDLNSLSEVSMYNIQWSCSCSNTWFVDFASTNNLQMYGDFMCSNVAGTSVWHYYNDNCLTAKLCDDTIGIVLMEKCLTMFAMIAYGCALVALVVTIVCLGLLICMRKQGAQKKTRRSNARSRWNKVMDVSIKSKTKKK